MSLGALLNPQTNARPLPLAVVALLAAAYLLLGLWHDPWKSEDAIHLGIAWGFARDGAGWVPAIAGEPWPHTAPLYHWVAAALGRALDGWLEFHNAARLATPLFGALFLVALAGAARALYGAAASRLAPLLAIGTLGLLTPLHEAQPAIAGLACAALAWWGATALDAQQRWGAPLIGLGLGLAFLAHGGVGVGMALPALVLPMLRRDGWAVLIATSIALPLLLLWPLALEQVAPSFWLQWWHNELAEATRARSLPTGAHLELMAWALWPVWPLTFWSLWLWRPRWQIFLLPALGLALTLAWFLSGPPRALALLPSLLPLVLLASAGADRLRRGAANAWDWFSVITFSFFAVLIWLGASAQALGWPARLARNFNKLAAGHTPDYDFVVLAVAGLATFIWLATWGLRRAPWRPVLRWATGLTVFWALLVLLWLSWIDHGMSLRPVALSLQRALPSEIDCLERQRIGAPERAILDYFAGIRTVAPGTARCNWRLAIERKEAAAPAGWRAVWQGGRTSDRKERWVLYQRIQ